MRLFPDSVPLEDLFTEAVARLLEAKPQLCLAWLKEVGVIPPARAARLDAGRVRVRSQRSLVPLEHHAAASRPDLLIEAFWPAEKSGGEGVVADVVMVESKIGSGEGQGQLRRYAEHLDRIAGADGRTLLYVTRAHDPKDAREILDGLGGRVRFEQLRWHDFYRFLQRRPASPRRPGGAILGALTAGCSEVGPIYHEQ